jgi:hypothetical protein
MLARMRWAAVLSACAMIGVHGGSALAQDGAPETDPLNHAYAVYMGGGLYVSGERSVFVFRLAPRIRIRSEKERSVGVRLRVNATFGFYDLQPADFQDFEIPDKLGTFALVPGVEFPVPLGDRWTLTPFVDAGFATDTEIHETTAVVGAGLRSRAALHDSRHTYLLWNEFVYARNSSTQVSATDDYTLFRTDFEWRGLARYRLGQRPFDLGLVAEADFYFDTVIIDLPLGEPVAIRYRWELGVSTGSTEPWKHFKNLFTAPRLGIGYRSGQGDSSIRLTILFRN